MQETNTIDQITLDDLKGKRGYFIVKIPNSKYTVLCTCTVDWTLKLLNPKTNETELLKEKVKTKDLNTFINNLLNTDARKINKKELKNLIN